MRIAIVGAGVSGLVAAHLLARLHDVTVYEAQRQPGGHVNTVRVDTAHETHWVDTGFIVFNDRNYPNFERLLRQLGVAWQPSDMSFGVSDETGTFEYACTSINSLFAKRRHLVSPQFHRMLADVWRFQREASALVAGAAGAAADGSDLSLSEWLERRRYSRPFVDRLIVPLVSAVWSADPRQMRTFPVRFLATFLDNHGLLALRNRPQWRTVVGGSHRYVEALTRPLGERLKTSSPIAAICRRDDHVLVTPRDGEARRYDEVVVAVHADQALALLADPDPRERKLLGAIPYQPSEAVLHTDERLLPRRRRAWASWNYHLLAEPVGKPTVTYNMNRLQRLRADRQFCVTLNRTSVIDPDKVIRTIPYAHPVFTAESQAAQARHAEINGRNRTHFCGAYWRWGFHEDGVVSALRVAEQLGAGGI
jgi:predicted NAD/FAD-binding protein